MTNARAGQRALENAADAIRDNDDDRADRELTTAREKLQDASSSLGSWWTWPARTVPGISRQYDAARRIVLSAEMLANAGSGPLGVLRAQPGGFALRNGAFDLAALQSAAEALTQATPSAEVARAAIASAPRSWLLPPLSKARTEAENEVNGAVDAIAKGAAGLRAAPTMLGASGPRRYLVLNSNIAELRGTGGVLSYYATMQADRGRLSLLPESGRTYDDFPTPAQAGVVTPKWYRDSWGRYSPLSTWQNINMTTDFPTAAEILLKTASAELGQLDGVIQIDPYGLAALLGLTGPVSVEGWPEPITSSNVAKVALHDAYIRFSDNPSRDAFSERLIAAVFGKFTTSSLQPQLGRLQDLGSAVTEGHIKVFSIDQASQEELALADIHGGVGSENATDVLGVFNQNASANKVDWFLRRSIRYEIRPGADAGSAFGILTVTLRNEAPSSGLPAYVIGPYGEGIAAGENRTILTVLRPTGSRLLAVSSGGRSSIATVDQDKDLRAHQMTLLVPAGGKETVEMVFALDASVLENYRLKVLTQPVVNADDCVVAIDTANDSDLAGCAVAR